MSTVVHTMPALIRHEIPSILLKWTLKEGSITPFLEWRHCLSDKPSAR